jgi:hypothetical protein
MIKITAITIVINSGADCILMETELPPSYYPWTSSPLLRMECAKGTGEDYCKRNFPSVPLKVVK